MSVGSSQLYPYFYPTTVAFVDDNRRFLTSISLQLDSEQLYMLFDSPLKAIEAIKHRNGSRSLHERILSEDFHSDNLVATSLAMNLDVSEIMCAVYDVRRYGEISVVVVDYDMPEMNGLEFCRKIDDVGIKKILLTGAADDKLAISAFNEGLIDAYINKADPNIFDEVNETVSRLQSAYFKDVSMVIAKAVNSTYGNSFFDARFAEYFKIVCDKLGIVEYYMMANPDGFLILDIHGRQYMLIVQSEDEVRRQIEFARNEKAPAKLLERLISREEIAYFPETRGYYDSGYVNWREYLHPAIEVVANKKYYCSLVERSPFDMIDDETMLSFADYLELSDVTKN